MSSASSVRRPSEAGNVSGVEGARLTVGYALEHVEDPSHVEGLPQIAGHRQAVEVPLEALPRLARHHDHREARALGLQVGEGLSTIPGGRAVAKAEVGVL